MTSVDWFNHRHLHGEITDDNTYTTSAEHDAGYSRQTPFAASSGISRTTAGC